MLYNEHNLAVAKIASKSEVREELAGVYFTANKTVATDSVRLLEVTVPANVKPEDYPAVEGATAMRGVQPFIVSAKMLRERVKLPKNIGSRLPILAHMAIKHLHDNRVEFLTTDLETANLVTVKRIMGKYPDYEKIFPTGEPVAEVEVNGEMLAEMLVILAKLGGANKAIKIKFYGNGAPVTLEAGNDNQKGRGMVMPLRK